MSMTMEKNGFFTALALGALLMVGAGCAADASAVPAGSEPENTPAPIAQEQGEVKEFAITAKQWAFEPAEVKVKKGDKVRLLVTSEDVKHGFSLPAFGIRQELEPGTTQTIEFTADQEGSHPFFCSVFCGAGHKGQRGTLIVE